MELIIQEFTSIYDFQLMILVVAIGLYTIMVDSRNLWTADNKKESILAKIIGWAYAIGGVGLFIASWMLG